jgi:hypothetical protein
MGRSPGCRRPSPRLHPREPCPMRLATSRSGTRTDQSRAPETVGDEGARQLSHPRRRPTLERRPVERRPYGDLVRSSSHTAKHRRWRWNLSNPGLPPSRANCTSYSTWSDVMGWAQTVHGRSTPGPPHVRSGSRRGSVPLSRRGGRVDGAQLHWASGRLSIHAPSAGALRRTGGVPKPDARGGRDVRNVYPAALLEGKIIRWCPRRNGHRRGLWTGAHLATMSSSRHGVV